MLVLSRKSQEKIRIGSDIVITVLRCKGSSVRLGIEAPSGTQVLRAELLESEDKSVPASTVAAQRSPESTQEPTRRGVGQAVGKQPQCARPDASLTRDQQHGRCESRWNEAGTKNISRIAPRNGVKSRYRVIAASAQNRAATAKIVASMLDREVDAESASPQTKSATASPRTNRLPQRRIVRSK